MTRHVDIDHDRFEPIARSTQLVLTRTALAKILNLATTHPDETDEDRKRHLWQIREWAQKALKTGV